MDTENIAFRTLAWWEKGDNTHRKKNQAGAKLGRERWGPESRGTSSISRLGTGREESSYRDTGDGYDDHQSLMPILQMPKAHALSSIEQRRLGEVGICTAFKADKILAIHNGDVLTVYTINMRESFNTVKSYPYVQSIPKCISVLTRASHPSECSENWIDHIV